MIETYYFKTIDSTNTEAKRILNGEGAIKAQTPFVLIANSQTAGRGRQGRAFYSPADTGIYMSVVQEISEDFSDSDIITVKAAVAVAEAIKAITGVDTQIKWVNDLYLNGRKVCGILAESVFRLYKGTENLYENDTLKRYIIIGIGINISTDVFPREIENIAGSIDVSASEKVKSAICDAIVNNIIYSKDNKSSVIQKYKKRSIVLGKDVTFCKNDILYVGNAFDINDKGELLVMDTDGVQHVLQSGEISLKSW